MQASDDIEDNWEQLLIVLGRAAQRQLVSHDNERSAAMIQLRAILIFLDQTAARGLITSIAYFVWRVGASGLWCQASQNTGAEET